MCSRLWAVAAILVLATFMNASAASAAYCPPNTRKPGCVLVSNSCFGGKHWAVTRSGILWLVNDSTDLNAWYRSMRILVRDHRVNKEWRWRVTALRFDRNYRITHKRLMWRGLPKQSIRVGVIRAGEHLLVCTTNPTRRGWYYRLIVK
jgi:hypothetical protein